MNEAHILERAEQAIGRQARPLEQALYQYEFAGTGRDQVLAELVKYQNEDGGFGRGLEPDFRCAASSALAVSAAFQILSRIKADPAEAIITRAFSYLKDAYKKEYTGWEKVPREVESAPRAPWWQYQEPRLDWGNPNAELLGYLYEFTGGVPDWAAGLEQKAMMHLERMEEYEFHEILCYIRLYDRAPKPVQESLEEPLKTAVRSCAVTDPGSWEGYGMTPLQAAPSPASAFYGDLAEAAERQLDFLLETQTEGGYWEPSWEWGFDDENWKKAKGEWRGILTLNHIRLLRNYGRL